MADYKITPTVNGTAVSLSDHTHSEITGATSANTANTIVKRDANGGFSAGKLITSAISDVNYKIIMNPEGGIGSGPSTTTGAIAIKFPVGFVSSMVTLEVQVFDYTTNETFTVFCSGYTASVAWINTSAYIISNPSIDRRFSVRFGKTADSFPIIYIGETSSTWSYPQVYITDVKVGYSGYSANYLTGWNISFVTAFETVQATITNPQIGYQSTSNTANSVVLRDASGNFSAGTITATALNVSGTADTATTATHYYVETASDGVIRPKTLANVKTEIVTSAAVNSAVSGSTLSANRFLINATDSAGAPGFSWTADGDTGIYSYSDGQLSFTANGTIAMRLTSSSQVNYGNIYLFTPDGAAATSTTTLVDSSLLYFRASHWNGSAAVTKDWTIYNNATGETNAKLQFSYLGVEKAAINELGDLTVAEGFRAPSTDSVYTPGYSWVGSTAGIYNDSGNIGFSVGGVKKATLTTTSLYVYNNIVVSAPDFEFMTGTPDAVSSKSIYLQGKYTDGTTQSNSSWYLKNILTPNPGIAAGYNSKFQFVYQGAEKAYLNEDGNLFLDGTCSATQFLGNASTATDLLNASYVQSTGRSTAWGSTNGTSTGAFNAVMGTGGNATWLLSGTSSGNFRAGIQVKDNDAEMRIFSGSSYLILNGQAISGLTNITGSGTADFSKFLGAAADTVTTPSFCWTGDTNTGLYRPAAKTIGFAANGSLAMTVTSSTQTNYGNILVLSADNTQASSGTTTVDSCTLTFRGFYWNGTASTAHEWSMYNDVTAVTPTSTFRIRQGSTTRASITQAGDMTITGALTQNSDRRLKNNITPIRNALDKVQAITGYEYDRIEDKKRCIGFVAQELVNVLPEVVNVPEDEKEYASVSYGNMVALLLEAVKELNEKVDRLLEGS